MANLDIIFVVFAASKPRPDLETVDKLIAIAEHSSVEPVVIVTKADLDIGEAERLCGIYRLSGITCFVTSSETGLGIEEVRAFVSERVRGGVTAAFAGASGVGKSTIMNAIFPGMGLATSSISKKIERGRHTTRHVEIFDVGEGEEAGFLADTPGFSLIDFSRFDFFGLEELADTFRELLPYRGACRYADCAHVGEGADECAVERACREGRIAESRLSSYRSIYRTLKEKDPY